VHICDVHLARALANRTMSFAGSVVSDAPRGGSQRRAAVHGQSLLAHPSDGTAFLRT